MSGSHRSRKPHLSNKRRSSSFDKKVIYKNNGGNDNRRVVLAPSILYLSIFLVAFLAFGIGCMTRIVVFHHNNSSSAATTRSGLEGVEVYRSQEESIKNVNKSTTATTHSHQEIAKNVIHANIKEEVATATAPSPTLPVPQVIQGKNVPLTTYTSKLWEVAGSAESNTVHIDRSTSDNVNRHGSDNGIDEESSEEESSSSFNFNSSSLDQDTNIALDDHEEVHLPAGQHLLIDIKHVSPSFLNSQHALATSMITLINESELTLLSYHCHSLVPIGVSCVGVLLESHIAFHTWPEEGVITLDLFTCGAKPLVPILPSLDRLFGIPPTAEERKTMDIGEDDDPIMVWAHKLRGFREEFNPDYDRESNPLDSGLGNEVLRGLNFDLKEPVVSTATKFQTVDIYDRIERPYGGSLDSYKKSMEGDEDSYEARNPELFQPDRVLFLGGVTQSSVKGDAPYHEALVHPVLIAHPNPRRVAIIGGGEGATLREVLKHKTVDEVVMIDIDEELISIAKEHLAHWNDCSDLMDGSNVKSCFDHPRASVYFADAMKWFMDRFSDDVDSSDEEKFDIIIMDALDPNDAVDIVDELYSNSIFLKSLYNGLTDNGAFVVQLGKAPSVVSPPDEFGSFRNRANVVNTLEELGVQTMHPYNEGHSLFYAPWAYLGAFKDGGMRKNWYRTPTEVDMQIEKRLYKMKSGKKTLRYFDGATMRDYQIPPKSFESIQCRIRPDECREHTVIASGNSGAKSKAYSPFFERHLHHKKTTVQKKSSFGNLTTISAQMSMKDWGNIDNANLWKESSTIFAHDLFADVAKFDVVSKKRMSP